MPRIAVFEGYGVPLSPRDGYAERPGSSIPRARGQTYPGQMGRLPADPMRSAGGQMGVYFGCEEADAIIQRIGVALHEAERVGVQPSEPRYMLALDFYNKETGYFSRTWSAFGETCQNMVKNATAILNGLNGAIVNMGGNTIVVPNIEPTPDDYGKPLADLKWVVVGVAVIAGVWMLAPVVRAATSKVKLKGGRGVAGYRRRRSRGRKR